MVDVAPTDLLAICGRVLLGALYPLSGWSNIGGFKGTRGGMEKRGVPLAGWVLAASIAFRIVVGGLFILGLWQFASAIALAAFTLAASAMMLDFWRMEGPARAAAVNSWKTNLALCGGLLLAASQAH